MDTLKTIIWYLALTAMLLSIPYFLMDSAADVQAEREAAINRNQARAELAKCKPGV